MHQRCKSRQPRATPWVSTPRRESPERATHIRFCRALSGLAFLKTCPQGFGSPALLPPLFPSAASALGWRLSHRWCPDFPLPPAPLSITPPGEGTIKTCIVGEQRAAVDCIMQRGFEVRAGDADGRVVVVRWRIGLGKRGRNPRQHKPYNAERRQAAHGVISILPGNVESHWRP